MINVLRIHQHDQTYAIVMEYGAETLMLKNTLCQDEIVKIIYDIACGIKELNKLGYSHKDLKPENILKVVNFLNQHVYKLCDFGVAKFITKF